MPPRLSFSIIAVLKPNWLPVLRLHIRRGCCQELLRRAMRFQILDLDLDWAAKLIENE
jgi:hypothetical protein